MARRPRQVIPGGVYHVMSRGNRREPVFTVDNDCLLFLDLVRQIAMRRQWEVQAYCLMENHYHLVVSTPDADLSAGMRQINGEYAQWFNRLHGFVGHVFQGRFRSVVVESDWHFLELSRYLALNPVRAGLCAAPANWRWGSYGAVVEGATAPLAPALRILEFFGREVGPARERFRSFVEDSREVSFGDRSGSDPDRVERIGF
jgi:putative transposase